MKSTALIADEESGINMSTTIDSDSSSIMSTKGKSLIKMGKPLPKLIYKHPSVAGPIVRKYLDLSIPAVIGFFLIQV